MSLPRAAAFGFLCLPVVALGPASAAELIFTSGDWKSYRHGTGDGRICFAVATPDKPRPSGTRFEPPHLYVTVWPRAGIKGEISVLLGRQLEKGAEVGVDIAGNSFLLRPDADRAFVADEAAEQRLLEAMRRGKSLTVMATAATGEPTRDTYSLSGVTAAMQAARDACSK